jgi:hypothetical protein
VARVNFPREAFRDFAFFVVVTLRADTDFFSPDAFRPPPFLLAEETFPFSSR